MMAYILRQPTLPRNKQIVITLENFIVTLIYKLTRSDKIPWFMLGVSLTRKFEGSNVYCSFDWKMSHNWLICHTIQHIAPILRKPKNRQLMVLSERSDLMYPHRSDILCVKNPLLRTHNKNLQVLIVCELCWRVLKVFLLWPCKTSEMCVVTGLLLMVSYLGSPPDNDQ